MNDLICSIDRSADANIPTAAGFTSLGSTVINTMWGVATSGTLIANGISGEGTDPFYPAIYGKTTDLAAATEKVDGCLAHPQ